MDPKLWEPIEAYTTEDEVLIDNMGRKVRKKIRLEAWKFKGEIDERSAQHQSDTH